jgi:hypothetical protein
VQRGGGGSVRRNKWHAKPPFGEPEAPANKTVFTDHFGLVSDVLAECFSRLQWSASSLLARFEVVNCRISALSQRKADPLHDKVNIPLFKGEFTLLDADAQTTIATWACMTTMTAEHLPRKPDAIVASQAQRKWLMKKRMPPQNWRIWIGKCKRQAWRGHWVRVTLPLREGDLAAAVAHYGRVPSEACYPQIKAWIDGFALPYSKRSHD